MLDRGHGHVLDLHFEGPLVVDCFHGGGGRHLSVFLRQNWKDVNDGSIETDLGKKRNSDPRAFGATAFVLLA
jgi:hypothetical protein